MSDERAERVGAGPTAGARVLPLAGRGLRTTTAARWLGAAYALATGTLVLLGLPHAFRILHMPCDGPACPPGQLSRQDVLALTGYGVSTAPYATFQLLAGLALFTLCWVQG
jgi:hypothetical protein